MRPRRPFQERAEITMISAMILGIVMIAQRWEVGIFQWGLRLLVVATILQIAVGNLPKDVSLRRGLLLILAIVLLVAVVFGIGIALVPVLSQLGQ